MNLDELHKVMKGDMTVDQACEGMTDDFEIGHVSHRADGDYRKVAQGKWVPVKAGGQGQKGASEKPAEQKGEPQGAEPDDDGPNTAMQDERSQFKFRKHITHAIPMGKEEEIALNRISSYFESGKRNASDAIDNYADHLIKENMENGNNNEAQERAVMRIAHAIGYGHELHDKIKRGRNGYDFGYDDERGSFYEGDNDEAPAAEPKAEGGKRQLKRRADGTIIYETPEDVIYDMVENYNELDRGDLQGVIEAAAMSHGWDENEILEEVDRQAAEKYNLGVDSADGVVKKVAELAQRDYKDVPGRVLTADTKIRLSRIKREQTQDERRTYRIGEISEKTGLQKTANGWREVKKGGAPAGGKAEVNPITGKPLRPETVAYAKQKKADAEQKRNTEKTAGGFTLAQNDKIKNAATDVIFKRRGEKLTPADLQREYKMSESEANEASRRINEYFSSLEKDRQEFAKAGEKKAQNAKPQASPMAGGKSAPPAPNPRIDRLLTSKGFINPPGKDFYVYKNKRGNIYKLKAVRYPDGKIMYRAQQPSGLFKDGHDLIEIIDRFEEDYGYFDDVPVVGAVMPRNVAIKENKHLLDGQEFSKR